MSITAAFLIQNVLKHFLEFGEVSNFLGYNALQNYFPTYSSYIDRQEQAQP